MIISENHFGKENCVAYCDVLIRRNYEVINADEHFYHFVEKLVGINFLDIVHQDNLKDFKMAFETIKPGENCRMLILLRNGIAVWSGCARDDAAVKGMRRRRKQSGAGRG